MSPIDQKTRPLKENHLIQRVLHRPVELAPLLVMWELLSVSSSRSSNHACPDVLPTGPATVFVLEALQRPVK